PRTPRRRPCSPRSRPTSAAGPPQPAGTAGAPAVELLNYSLRLSLFNDLPPHPSTDIGVAGFSLPGAAPIGGLGAFILAEVFAYGARLRADVEGTV
ncbi:MAG: hypothetical protein QOD13_3765, partial [Thermoleophilaceae bacterium]|nr:hypothetical protein [Thermoleophilaceae bacterium]